MPGSLTVLIIMPGISDLAIWEGWQAAGAQAGQWRVDGGAWQMGGATVDGLADGPHVVTFQNVNGISPSYMPQNQTVNIVDGETTITAGTYNFIGPESLLETATYALRETPTYALDTILGTPLFLAASAMDAAFSGYGPAKPGQNQGVAYTAAKVMGAYFEETYSIMLEGGQVASDFATQAELDAIAGVVAPYLSGSQPYAGGVPIRAGYNLLKRETGLWTIQRGKGFSLAPAIDIGYVAGLPGADLYYVDDVPAEQEVGGFIVSGNGLTFPTEFPGECAGMVNTVIPGDSPISGYPIGGGANISQLGKIAGAVSIHTVNADGTINAAMIYGQAWQTDFNSDLGLTFGNSVIASMSDMDYWNQPYFGLIQLGVTTLFPGVAGFLQSFPPAYYVGSPDWTANTSGGTGFTKRLSWNGTNGQTVTLPFALIFWIGKTPQQVPQFNYINGPTVGDFTQMSPDNVNAAINPFNASDYNLFWVK